MKKLALLLSGISGLLLFSGCSFFDDTNPEISEQSITYIELEGVLVDENADRYALSEYALINAEQEKIANLESNVENLQKFLGKKVILKGEKTFPENTQNPEISGVVSLNVIQIKALPASDKKFESALLGVSVTLFSEFLAEEKDARFHVIKKSTEEEFFTIFWQKNEDWKNKFLSKGEKIIIKDFDVWRLYSGKRIQLYFPKTEIQIDYWGEKNGEYDFYKIIETLEFFEKTKKTSEDCSVENSHGCSLPDKNKTSSSEISRKNTDESSEEKIQKNTQKTEILKKIEEKISTESSDSENSVTKISLYKNFADVEISGKSKNTRIVYEILENSDLQEVARFTEGEIQSWDLESGEIPHLAGASEIFLSDISDEKPIVLPENFALYISTHFDFQVGYPRKMYYRATGKQEDSLASVNWSTSPLTPENSEIRLEIVAGEISEEKVLEDENTIIFPRDEKTHFKLSALHDNFSIVQAMRKNFRSEK